MPQPFRPSATGVAISAPPNRSVTLTRRAPDPLWSASERRLAIVISWCHAEAGVWRGLTAVERLPEYAFCPGLYERQAVEKSEYGRCQNDSLVNILSRRSTQVASRSERFCAASTTPDQ